MSDMTLELSDMRQAAGRACNLMKVLSNPDRLMILCQLSQGEKRLRDEQLVSTRREGKSIYYSINSPEALSLIETLYQQFCGHSRQQKS
jgi:DNA-binding transcriptional ArsR family regulator